MNEILYLLEMMNGADGISDIEGKATRVGARWSRGNASDIDGQTERSNGRERIESKRGQRMSFKTAVLFGAAALWCVPCLAKAESADERLRAIYTEEWKWRLEQFPGLEGVEKPVPDRLPSVDPATQEMRLRYWQDVLHKLDDVPRAQLSPEEQINYDVYRPEIENFVADQKFRDHEMPANSDSAFWTDFGYTARRPFKTLTDYKNWIAQMRDIPRYFHEQIANMRAGLARGFTPPRLTLQGREKSIATIAEGKPEDNLLYTPFREPMVGVQPSDQDKLKSEAAQVIRKIVQPAYADLLKFFRDEYVPHTRTTLAAEALPDGKTYYRQKIREFTTLDLSPDEIHQIGLAEVAKLHQQMADAMRESGFKGEFPAFLKFLRDDPQFYAKTPQELLNRAAWIAKVFDGKSSQYFGYLPRMRFTIKPVPPDLAPVLYFRPWRSGHLSPEHIRSAASSALQSARADPARVRAWTRIPDSDRAGTQEPAGLSAIRLHFRVR